MTALKFVPLTVDLAGALLLLLRDVKHGDAARLSNALGEAIAIAGDHVSEAEMLAAELLELIGRTSGRAISTIPNARSLDDARDALADTVPQLGKVIALPRVPERETAQALEAAATRAVMDMPGPITIRPFVQYRPRRGEPNYQELHAVSAWAVPREREPWCGHVVVLVEWDLPNSVRLVVTPHHNEGDTF